MYNDGPPYLLAVRHAEAHSTLLLDPPSQLLYNVYRV